MPTAPSRLCPRGHIVAGSRSCPACDRQHDIARGTAHARGYTYRDWQPFRRRFLAQLVDASRLAVCGATLPDGPATTDSQCRLDDVFTFESEDGSSLHLDHEPPLLDAERLDPSAVCDPTRIQLLCDRCHNAKSARERQQANRGHVLRGGGPSKHLEEGARQTDRKSVV